MRAGQTCGEASRRRRNAEGLEPAWVRDHVVVDRIERIACRNQRAPRQPGRKREEHPLTLRHDAEHDQDADEAWLKHQRHIQLSVRMAIRKALLTNEPEL